MIKNTKLKKSTIDLYNRVLDKLNITSILDLHNHDLVIENINNLSSISYKIMAYRAIHSILDDQIYEAEYKKLVQLQNDKDNIGVLPMTLSELLSIEVKCQNELQQVVESFTIYMNTHYPLRLDYYNVVINPTEVTQNINYMTYYDSILTFYLNDFKNVHSFGKQIITYSDLVICSYLAYLTNYFNESKQYYGTNENRYLLYRYDKSTGTLQSFSSRVMYGDYLTKLFKKYTGKNITMNTIRKIHESDIIQSPEYAKMSNLEKQKKHSLLLHSTATANSSYNILQ